MMQAYRTTARRAGRTARHFALLIAMLAAHARAQQFVDQTATRFPVPNPADYTNQLTIGDIDNDGDLDIIFANGSSLATPEPVRVYINNGSGTFTDESAARVGGLTGSHRGVELGDCDRDGDLDMVLAQDFDLVPHLLINNGAGVFTNESVVRLPNIVLSSSRGQFGDVDNDGDLDLFFTSGQGSRFGCGQYRLYLNDGTCHYTDATNAQFPIASICENMDCIFGDIDNDFDIDLRTGNRGADNSRLYRNDGAGTFTVIPGVPADSSTYSYDFGDVNGDGALDLLGANGGSGNSEILLINDGTGAYTDASANITPNPSIDDNDSKFFDYDNDGDLDLIIGALGGSAERIYNNNGSGVFTEVVGLITAVSDSTLDIKVGDLTGDRRLDIVTGQGESGSFLNRVYINTTGPIDNRPPRIIAVEQQADTLDFAGPYVIRALILDDMSSDRNFFDRGVTLHYARNGGGEQTLAMRHSGGQVYRAALPGQPGGSLIEYWVSATDFANNTGTGPPAHLSFQIGEPDCNATGLPDRCDLSCNDPGGDCNVADCGLSTDCDMNDIPDECEAADCNGNEVPDGCDISSGGSLDLDADGVPDECRVRRVRLGAPAGGDGLTWQTAYASLSGAISAAAIPGNAVRELWVAWGTHKPDTTGLANPRTAAFVLRSGVACYGGFTGTETQRTQRDPAAHPTILSGDLAGDDGPNFTGYSENAYHVVTASGTDATAVLDGFTLTGGNATSGATPNNAGGGFFASAGAAIVRRCVLTANRATLGGGAFVSLGGAVTLANCRFAGNAATLSGGGLAITQSPITLVNCVFSGNTASNGGAVFSSTAAPTIVSCTLAHNSATSGGGGIRATGNLAIADCILWGNRVGAASDQAAQINASAGTLSVSYSVVQGLTGALVGNGNIGADPLLVDADGGDNVAGTHDDDLRLSPGSPVIDAGSNAALPADGADVDGDGDTGEALPLDLDLLPRRADDSGVPDTGAGTAPIVDIGAYERQAAVVTGGACCVPDVDGDGGAGPTCVDVENEAACAALRYACNTATNELPECGGPCGTTCYGDVNGDGAVTPGDRGFIAANIGQTAYALLCQYDLDGNGFINAGDRGFVAANIGLCSPLPNYQNGSGLNAAGDGPDGRFAAPVFHGVGTSCAIQACP